MSGGDLTVRTIEVSAGTTLGRQGCIEAFLYELAYETDQIWCCNNYPETKFSGLSGYVTCRGVVAATGDTVK